MSLISGLVGSLGSVLGNGQTLNATTALRTNEEQDSERIARMRRQSEALDSQAGHGPAGGLDRGRAAPPGFGRFGPDSPPPPARVDGRAAPGQADGATSSTELSGARVAAPGQLNPGLTGSPPPGLARQAEGLVPRTIGAVDRAATTLIDGLTGRSPTARTPAADMRAFGGQGPAAPGERVAARGPDGPRPGPAVGPQGPAGAAVPPGPPTAPHGPQAASSAPGVAIDARGPGPAPQGPAPTAQSMASSSVAAPAQSATQTLASAAPTQQGAAAAPPAAPGSAPISPVGAPNATAAPLAPNVTASLGAQGQLQTPAVLSASAFVAQAQGQPVTPVAPVTTPGARDAGAPNAPGTPSAHSAPPPSLATVGPTPAQPQLSNPMPFGTSVVAAQGPAPDQPFAAIAPIAAIGGRGAGEALTARHVAAIAQAERVDGPAAGIRELKARVRDLPAGAAGEIVGGSAALIDRAAGLSSGAPLDRVERIGGLMEREPPSAARAAADLASSLDAAALDRRGAHVTREVAQAIANAQNLSAERLIAFGQGAAFGTGLALPLALLDACDERGDGGSARTLESALVSGLFRLIGRLSDAVAALGRAAGPVAFEWAAWRAKGLSGRELERRLRTRLAGETGLLEDIDAALEAVEQAGFDAVNALERLSGWGGRSPEIFDAWRRLAASPAAAFAIAQSLAAQHVVVQIVEPGFRSEPPETPDAEIDLDAARRLYAAFGFAPERADMLAAVTRSTHTVVQMGGGWMRARRPRDRDSEAAFARLVAYLEGRGAPENRYVETVTLADLDRDGSPPLTLVGAPLLKTLDLTIAA